MSFFNFFFFFNFINGDSARFWQIGFQDPATPIMEGLINLHHYICFFLVGSFVSKNYPDNYPNKYDEVIFRSSRIKYQPTKLIHYYSDMEVGVL